MAGSSRHRGSIDLDLQSLDWHAGRDQRGVCRGDLGELAWLLGTYAPELRPRCRERRAALLEDLTRVAQPRQRHATRHLAPIHQVVADGDDNVHREIFCLIRPAETERADGGVDAASVHEISRDRRGRRRKECAGLCAFDFDGGSSRVDAQLQRRSGRGRLTTQREQWQALHRRRCDPGGLGPLQRVRHHFARAIQYAQVLQGRIHTIAIHRERHVEPYHGCCRRNLQGQRICEFVANTCARGRGQPPESRAANIPGTHHPASCARAPRDAGGEASPAGGTGENRPMISMSTPTPMNETIRATVPVRDRSTRNIFTSTTPEQRRAGKPHRPAAGSGWRTPCRRARAVPRKSTGACTVSKPSANPSIAISHSDGVMQRAQQDGVEEAQRARRHPSEATSPAPLPGAPVARRGAPQIQHPAGDARPATTPARVRWDSRSACRAGAAPPPSKVSCAPGSRTIDRPPARPRRCRHMRTVNAPTGQRARFSRPTIAASAAAAGTMRPSPCATTITQARMLTCHHNSMLTRPTTNHRLATWTAVFDRQGARDARASAAARSRRSAPPAMRTRRCPRERDLRHRMKRGQDHHRQ